MVTSALSDSSRFNFRVVFHRGDQVKFKQHTRRPAGEYEKYWLTRWKEEKTFEKSIKQRPVSNRWVFYDGPPFLTGTPHHGHLLISTVKDAMGRFHTMKGQRVERRWGWDCHGLPAELFVEKQLGIKSKKEIGKKISIEEYVRKCREAMVKTGTEWEDTIERLGRWVEFEGAYKTMDNDYMESIWWAFKTLYDNGKIYEGEKILFYCTNDATPISKSEVAMENSYRLDTDPSVYVFFKLDNVDGYLLAWTTTPWTLPANVAIAVNKDIEYSLIEHDGKKFYLGSETISRVMQDDKHQPLDYTVIKQVKGKELIGLRYEPLFENRGPESHRILQADFVNTDEGTGIVHEAPAYGEEDYELSIQERIPIVSIVDADGLYTEGRWQGKNIWDVNKTIAKTLVEEGKALKIDYITHEYPHCHRCGKKLMYRAHPSWFMDIQEQKAAMLNENDKTRWFPDNIRTGRFKNIIEQAPDWNLSRDRYWATPIPVWKGVRTDGTEVIKVFGSYQEFEQLTGKKLNDYHLPEVMNITFKLDNTEMHHIGKVLDCWFESGSMPFAQFHYPFENKEKFESMFPADFIAEAIDQTRGWFYSLTAVNVALFNKSPFKNLICTGFINAADGKKMSKKLKNYTDPMELMDLYSADSYRFLLMASPLTHGEDFSLANKDVADVARKLNMIWNMYDFFSMYAEVDGWQYNGRLIDPTLKLTNSLDIWVVSRLHQLIAEVEERMEAYDLGGALKPVLTFIDDASNWYVRRSRRRFWKSEDDTDKSDAYLTLHYVLTRLSIMLAPFTPFLSEELYRNMTGDHESVHLKEWLPAGYINNQVMYSMDQVRELVNQGLSLRAKAGIKVRQPLSKVVIISSHDLNKELKSIIMDELNVKKVEIRVVSGVKDSVELDLNITDELKKEGLAREIIRNVQQARKAAGLEVDDRIYLSLSSKDKEVLAVLDDDLLKKEINRETLTVHLNDRTVDNYSYLDSTKVDAYHLDIRLSKAEVN